jgi:polygalacturonase
MTPTPSFDISRRSLLASAAAGAVILGASPKARAQTVDPWAEATQIASQLSQPVAIPGNTFNVRSYGAVPIPAAKLTTTNAYLDSTTSTYSVNTPTGTGIVAGTAPTDCFVAFNKAILTANAAGGGRVVVPAGNWYCAGPIILLSNVEFHLNSGAQIYFDPTPACYTRNPAGGTYPTITGNPLSGATYAAMYSPSSYSSIFTNCGTNGYLVLSHWQGNDCYNYCPPIYAYNQTNIALTGDDWTSVFNGQAGVSYTSAFPLVNNTPNVGHAGCWWTFKAGSNTAGWLTGEAGEGGVNPNNTAISSAYIPSSSPVTAALAMTNTSATGTQSVGTNYQKDSSYLPAQSECYLPVTLRNYGIGHYLPPPMIQLHSCTNVLFQGYQVTNTPFWQHNPVNCTNVSIYGVYANSNGPNNDGFDPDGCNNVLIDTVTFNTGDDCIAVKAGKDNDIGFGPCQNIVIQNCTMNSGHGGITMGSEMSGGIQNVYAQNLTFANLNYATNPLQIGIRVKTNLNRGGFIKNLYIRNISIPNGISKTPGFLTPFSSSGSGIPVSTAADGSGGLITFDCDYSPSSDAVRIRPPIISNVNISNVTVGNSPSNGNSCYQAIVILGPVGSDFDGTGTAPTVYPVNTVNITNCNFGTPVATTPWFIYNAVNVTLTNVTIAGTVYNKTISTGTTLPITPITS